MVSCTGVSVTLSLLTKKEERFSPPQMCYFLVMPPPSVTPAIPTNNILNTLAMHIYTVRPLI